MIGNFSNSVDRHSAKSNRLKVRSGLGISADNVNRQLQELDQEAMMQFLNAEFAATRTNGAHSTFNLEQTRSEFVSLGEDIINDDMPQIFEHVRMGKLSVRREIYSTAHTLSSTYHMSPSQIEGAFIVVSGLFGKNWKAFQSNTEIDKDTLPEMTLLARRGKALSLNDIVS